LFTPPPLEKGGQGGFETWGNPPKSPFAKGGFLDQGRDRRREKRIKKNKQNNAPGNSQDKPFEGVGFMKQEEIVLKVNGTNYHLSIEPRRTLVEVLRENLGLTGTKKSCNEGDCGACTVLMNGRPVASCLVLAMDAQGKEILTIEGLSEGEKLHPIQEAFLKHGAIQCGFCTPGMVMSAKALLDENPEPTTSEVRKAISGNLCRCTGYQHIVDSIMAASKMMQKKS
jgi:aerobic carbon-monoxide dehydrogenase small subunit